jgi:hypothetical protein
MVRKDGVEERRYAVSPSREALRSDGVVARDHQRLVRHAAEKRGEGLDVTDYRSALDDSCLKTAVDLAAVVQVREVLEPRDGRGVERAPRQYSKSRAHTVDFDQRAEHSCNVGRVVTQR